MTAFSSPLSGVVGRRRCASILALFVLAIAWWSPTANAEVVALTDQTFEHQTQASTGMTTGSWLVLFSVPDCPSCESLKPVLEELGTDEEVYESGIVLGSVDCSQNQAVCLRFSTTKLPVLLYLHKKQLYKFPRDEEFGTPPTLESLKSFVLSPNASLAQAIPDPPSALDAFLKPILLVAEKNPLAGYAILGMMALMGFTILVLVVTLVKGGSSSGSAEKKTKKTKSSKKNK